MCDKDNQGNQDPELTRTYETFVRKSIDCPPAEKPIEQPDTTCEDSK